MVDLGNDFVDGFDQRKPVEKRVHSGYSEACSGEVKRRKNTSDIISDDGSRPGFWKLGGEVEVGGKGLKMLEKMGFKGGGLGRNGQGTVALIEAKLRPKRMGMGFNGCDQRNNYLPNVAHERKQGSDGLIARVRGSELDVTGTRVRVFTNLENVSAEVEEEEEEDRVGDVPMVELLHNVRLLVDMVENDKQKMDMDLINEMETVEVLNIEKEKLVKKAAQEKKLIDNVEEILIELKIIEKELVSGTVSLESLEKWVGELPERFVEEYKMCNLSWIACSYALPLLIRVFERWDPLENPSYGIDVISMWKNLLLGNGQHDILLFEDASSPYFQLVNEVMFPAERIAGLSKWQPRDPEPMLQFLELWENLLPAPVLGSILDMVVMPKLSEALKSWDPHKETVPIHLWIHPWLPLFGHRLDSLYQAVHGTLANALQNWQPSDMLAYTILSPWKAVFDAASWEHLIVESIFPKLINVMQEFQVSSTNQTYDPFCWVMGWASDVPNRHMVSLLEIHFFSKWKKVLYHLLSSNPNFEEVRQWYIGWKQLIPAELLANERVRHQLNEGLNMMNQALEGLEVVQPGVKENTSNIRAREKIQFENKMSFKEVIEVYAQEHGLLFKPKLRRSHNHHQIYSFGSVSVTVDSLDQMVFALVEGQWFSVSLEQLLQMQSNSGSRRH